MIKKIEDNEFGFVKQWSKMTELECGTLFVNPNLPDDPFFDKLTNITCLNGKMIEKAVGIFQKNNTCTFVYALNDKNLEEFLQQRNFTLFDTQHVLTKIAEQELSSPSVTHITKENSLLWSEIFCRSYDCYEWLDEVNSIVKRTSSNIEYLIDAEHHASCVALYEKNSILGLYCLGTVPEKRQKGLAKLLINYALYIVKTRRLDFLMLETYMKDNLISFYSKLGFKKIYEKKIYTI